MFFFFFCQKWHFSLTVVLNNLCFAMKAWIMFPMLKIILQLQRLIRADMFIPISGGVIHPKIKDYLNQSYDSFMLHVKDLTKTQASSVCKSNSLVNNF